MSAPRISYLLVGLLLLAPVSARQTILENRITVNGGNASADGNNYTTGISFSRSGTTLTLDLARLGMANLTASFTDQEAAANSTDGNNYTSACSVSGTDTKTATCSRNGWNNYTYSWTDLDTDTDTTYTNGSGLSLTGTQFNHTDTSSQSSSDNSGRTYIQDIILDTFGHITSIVTAAETVTDTDTIWNINASELQNQSGVLGLNKSFFTAWDQSSSDDLTIAQVTGANGNWSADKSLYATLAYVNTLGNWSADKSSYATTVYVNTLGNFSRNATSWEVCNGGDYSRWNGSGFKCFTDQTGSAAAPTVRNITYLPAFRSILHAASPAGISITGMPTTARCTSFPVERNDQASFDSVKTMVDNTNASIGVYHAIYNCTSSQKHDCTAGSILLNFSIYNLGSLAMQGPTNTTGNWTLPSGNYVMCTSTNTTNGQSGVLRGTTGSQGTGSTLRLTVVSGAFPASATFTASESDGVPFVFLYRSTGVEG